MKERRAARRSLFSPIAVGAMLVTNPDNGAKRGKKQMAKQIPEIGRWYQDAVEDVLFEVVAVDERTATVEVQYEDGEVGEFDFDTWVQLVVLPAEAPEDWRVPYELSSEDDQDPDAVMVPDNFSDPLVSLEGDSWFDLDDLP